MLLNVPNDFTSTLTYQNSNYSFPHESILSLDIKSLTLLFLSKDYILPDYINYYNTNINNTNIINRLKNNQDFIILGVSFMKFKGIEEKWDELINISLNWKQSHTHAKMQDKINLYINDNLIDNIYKIQYITNILQLMIINIINHIIDENEFPEWMLLGEFKEIVKILNKLLTIKTISIPVSITLYVTQIVPLINELYDLFNENVIINN